LNKIERYSLLGLSANLLESGCAIKGNISRKGERWFCSAKEAADAGFRAPGLR
jgi:hypothetical protein